MYFSTRAYYQLLEERLPVASPELMETDMPPPNPSASALLRQSGPVTVYRGEEPYKVEGYRGWFRRWLFRYRRWDRGHLFLYDNALHFRGPRSTEVWSAEQITCVTTDGHYLELKIRHQPTYHFHFHRESPLKYQLILQKWLRRWYRSRGETVLEFQPRILTRPPRQPRVRGFTGSRTETVPRWERLLKGIAQKILKAWLRLWIRVTVCGDLEALRSGKGFVIANHQSIMDPFIIGAFLDYRIAFLTKSTSFGSRLSRTFLSWAMGIPTTRFQRDPLVIRHIDRFLKRGVRVGIFPEGERCWDGGLQPFKWSVVKLLMSFRQPIYPILLVGAYRFWPRWASLPAPARIILQVEAPFCLLPNQPIVRQRQFLEEYFRERIQTLEEGWRNPPPQSMDLGRAAPGGLR